MASVVEIGQSVIGIGDRLKAQVEAFGWNKATPLIQTIGGYAPTVSPDFIINYSRYIGTRISSLTQEELDNDGQFGKFLSNIPAQANVISFSNIQNDADAVIGGAMMLLQTISGRFPPPIIPTPKVNWDDLKDEKNLVPKDLARRLRGVEAQIALFEPRAANLEQVISDIESAREAAEQLPADLAELSRQRGDLKTIIDESQTLSANIKRLSDRALENSKNIESAEDRVQKLLERSEQALRGSTSVGLANAFDQRKKSLTLAMISWTIGLIAALVSALVIGADRVSTLKDVLVSDRSATVIWVNALLAALGVGAPIWFAWLSTKQIGVNFRLAEDYAFKASVSKAYEGYRKEAIEIDEALQERLFASALSRLEEAPIRLLDAESHSSPLQELLSNPVIRNQLEKIPNIAERIVDLIPGKSDVVKMLGAGAASAGTVAKTGHEEE